MRLKILKNNTLRLHGFSYFILDGEIRLAQRNTEQNRFAGLEGNDSFIMK
jgi:hypothetical protein